MSVNVNRSLSDQFYRYKMPKIIAKVEGKGNGIKTVIVNMVEIAKALNRPPMYPTKFFGCVLGAQTNFDKNERYIVNGSHDSSKLQDILDGFIQKYVLCPGCQNPETDLHVSAKRGLISTSCKACGYSGVLPHKDKLAAYIIKCPPVEPKKKVDKEKSKKSKSKKGGDDDSAEEPAANDNNGLLLNGNHKNRGDDDEDWCEDTDADAVAKRMSMLTTGVNRLMANDDLEKSSEDRLQIFFEYFKKLNETHDGNFDVNMQKEIVAEAERLDIRDKAILVLCEVLFNENILQQIKNHRLLLLRFCAEHPKAQKYLLRGFELTIKEYRNHLLPKVAHILKTFYDMDIIDEKEIIGWGNKAYKKTVGKELAEQIHEKAAPILKWLNEADVEDSDDACEEELDVVYDDRARVDKILVQKEETPSKLSPLVQSTHDDELDIDAI